VVLRRLLERLDEAKVQVADVGLRRPTLDDVFLSLTGHVAEEAPSSEDADGDSGSGAGSRGRRSRKDESRVKEAVR
jgi:ABC-2 type transport system ATP-binding protein